MPKRHLSAFFVFLKSFKEANPDNNKVSIVVKEGGEKWKLMTEEEKKPYVEKASELKAEFDKAMETYNAEKALEDNEEESSEKENEEPDEKGNEEPSEEKAEDVQEVADDE